MFPLPRNLLVFLLFAGGQAAAHAQTFGGTDDFNGGDAKWAYFFRLGGATATNGEFAFTGSALQFTKAAGAGSYVLGWDDDPASATSSRVAASYTSDWVMEVTATNLVSTASGEYLMTGLEVGSGPGVYTALLLGSVNGAPVVKLETNGHPHSVTKSIATATAVRLRLSWSAAGQSLSGSYSVDGGASYVVVGSVPITRWGTPPTDGFYFETVANSNKAAAVGAGEVVLDDFSITAATIAGSEDFSGGTGKWATTYRTEEAAGNGVLTFNGSVAEFTKSAGWGGHHYIWDGDGIAGNGTYTIPASYATSWVMEAKVRNSVVAETGTWASIGIEVATAPGSYTDLLLENYSGELLVVGETNTRDNIEDVTAPAGTDVWLRLVWDASLRTLTGKYSFDGGVTYTTLASIPISVWPISPADSGFIFSITGSVTANAAVVPGQMRLDDFSITTAPLVTTQPSSQAPALGAPVTLSAGATGAASYQWQQNGANLAGQTNSTLTLADVQPANAGVYGAVTSDGTIAVATDLAIVGVTTSDKAAGTAEEVGADIRHANGNIFDQLLLQGPAATIRADAAENQITRMSYIDGNNDIVQVEFSGAGNVSVVLAGASSPALPVNYEQNVNYVKGHAAIVVTGANETTNLSVFTVGRGTAVNPALFKDNVTYDGMADIAFVAISSTDGKFGGLRTANAHYWATQGIAGVYAPGVQFLGPVYVGDVEAMDDATPVLMIGAGTDTRITGGDLQQANGRAVQVSGLTSLQFTLGSTSHYQPNSGSDFGLIPAQTNQAVLEESGVVVTGELVATP